MFSREIFGQTPQYRSQGQKFTGLVYGRDAVCRRCGVFHAPDLTPGAGGFNLIACETDKTELMASKVAASADLKEKGMVGILIDADGKIALAVSGNTKKANLVLAAAESIYQGLELAGDVNILDYITNEELGHCRSDGAAPPGNCAAPKLIGHAIAGSWKLPFAISEVWSDKKNVEKEKFNKNEPIESCIACGKLVPLMMCSYWHNTHP